MAFTRGKQSHVEQKAIYHDVAWTEPGPECESCGDEYNPKRRALGYPTCLACGEPRKTFTAVPVPKSNYIIATSASGVLSPYSHKGTR